MVRTFHSPVVNSGMCFVLGWWLEHIASIAALFSVKAFAESTVDHQEVALCLGRVWTGRPRILLASSNRSLTVFVSRISVVILCTLVRSFTSGGGGAGGASVHRTAVELYGSTYLLTRLTVSKIYADLVT